MTDKPKTPGPLTRLRKQLGNADVVVAIGVKRDHDGSLSLEWKAMNFGRLPGDGDLPDGVAGLIIAAMRETLGSRLQSELGNLAGKIAEPLVKHVVSELGQIIRERTARR